MNNLQESLHTNNEGKIMGYKRMIKEAVYTHEINCWSATMSLLHSLPFYDSSVPTIQLHPWWEFTKAVPNYYRQVSSIIAIICGAQPKFFQCNFDNRLCCLCCDRELDTPVHILFECSALAISRNLYLSKIRLSMPLAMKQEFNDMTNSNKCRFIFSAMNMKYCADFKIIYKSMASFIFEMYRARKKLYQPP